LDSKPIIPISPKGDVLGTDRYSKYLCSNLYIVEPAYKDILWISDLFRIIEALTRKPVHKYVTVLRIALSYLVKTLISRSASIALINCNRSTSLWAGSTVARVSKLANRTNNFPLTPITLHIPMRLPHLLPLKHLININLELSSLPKLLHILL
jgi:hypothetical protein